MHDPLDILDQLANLYSFIVSRRNCLWTTSTIVLCEFSHQNTQHNPYNSRFENAHEDVIAELDLATANWVKPRRNYSQIESQHSELGLDIERNLATKELSASVVSCPRIGRVQELFVQLHPSQFTCTPLHTLRIFRAFSQ